MPKSKVGENSYHMPILEPGIDMDNTKLGRGQSSHIFYI